MWLPYSRTGISAGGASCRPANTSRCSRWKSRRTTARGSAEPKGRAAVAMLQAAAERAFRCGTPPRPPPPASSHPSSCSPSLAPFVPGLAAQPAAGSAALAPAPADVALKSVRLAARRAWRAAGLNPVPPPTSLGGAAGERAAQAPVDGPGSCCRCATARGGPTNGGSSGGCSSVARRGQAFPWGQARPAQRAHTATDGDVHVVGAAGRARRRSLMGAWRQLAGTVRRSYGGEVPPVVQGRGSARQIYSPARRS